MQITLLVLFLTVGLFLGLILGCILATRNTDGVIVIDRSIEDEKPNIFLELKNYRILQNRKSAFFKVEHRNYITHE